MGQRMIPPSEKGYQPSAKDVEEAVEAFKRNGGLIRKLYDQTVPVNKMVLPKNYYSGYEEIGLFLDGNSG